MSSVIETPATSEPRPSPAEPSLLLQRALALVGEDLQLAEERLAALLESTITIIPEVGGHLTFAGGKRFRPLLALLCAKAAGFEDPSRITIAAVGELLHTATLLHDDVIDGGEFRRGRPAARLPYGNGLAVLTGDYCLARALQAVARTGHIGAVKSMADAVTLMAEGEVAQLHVAGDPSLNLERYLMVIDRKTAALLAWCSSVGGLLEPAVAQPLHRFGIELGYAFQIADDILDYRAAAPNHGGETGKEPGQDLRDGKMTLPLILACQADPTLHQQVAEVVAAGPPMAADQSAEIIAKIRETDALERATRVAEQHAQRAQSALATLPHSVARQALATVADYVVRRNR